MNEEDDRTRISNTEDMTVLSTNGGAPLSSTEDATVLSSGTVSSSWPTGEGQRLTAGQEFGPYSIVKLLGHGGMGEVYEAVQVESGRRVALKLLRGMMVQHEDRARFLREGRLAASISHPHTVYIFGSEEIGDMPVISMQLLPGGTLKDRVIERGPMPTAEAVAAILDVIGGLDAAASAGILHRDIKPSNCFVDVDGSVKVGDFGLSISTSARDGGATKGFQGTPQYAAPEQLRGEPLDVRADIYAVGATLFYLLTGRAPFDARDFQQLVEQVKTSPAPLAHKVRPEIPAKLSAVIAKCLAKTAAERPASYADLARALRPFSGEAVPAPRGVRILAGVIDWIVLSLPSMFIQSAEIRTSRGNTSVTGDAAIWPIVLGIAYFAAAEAIWSTTLGKKMFGLRVVSTAGQLTWRQTLGRALIFYLPRTPLPVFVLAVGVTRATDYLTSHLAIAGVLGSLPLLSILLFATMRRTNGLAAVHDLLTRTRVVQRRFKEFRSASSAQLEKEAGSSMLEDRRRFGPFVVGHLLGDIDGGRLLEGVDTVLKRRVWLVEWNPGAPETPRLRRDVDRVGRLHWLAGRRAADENWDAFEAPQGAPLDATPGAASWKSAQGWLNDLVAELAACERDKSMPVLSLDRVWIRQDGRAVLLDFPAPQIGTGSNFAEITPGTYSEMTPGVFLATIGRLALKGATPMPVSAVAMLDRWVRAEKKAALPMEMAVADLVAISDSPEKVSRLRRLTPIALSAAPIVMMLLSSIFVLRNVNEQVGRTFGMTALLQELDKETNPRRRQAFETYLAGTYRTELNDEASWKQMIDKDDDNEVVKLRELSRRAASLQPTPEETAAAAYLVQPALDKIERKRAGTSPESIFVILMFVGSGMAFFPSLISVLARPSGLVLSALGLAVVVKSGRETSRFRAVIRLTIGWLPMALFVTLASVPATRAWAMGSILPVSIALGLMAVGVIWTILRPTRGPHDIAAGTTIGVR